MRHIHRFYFPTQQIVELADRTIVPRVQKLLPREIDSIPLPEEQQMEPIWRRSSNKSAFLNPTSLRSEAPNFVTVYAQRYGVATALLH